MANKKAKHKAKAKKLIPKILLPCGRCKSPFKASDRLRRERFDLCLTCWKAKMAAQQIKRNARSRVSRALKSGKLERLPCEVCGDEFNVDAHHDDYSKPLEVRWLCHKHHMELHNTECFPPEF